MDNQEVDKKFEALIYPPQKEAEVIVKKIPAKFPELRYLWGVALIGSFVLIVLSSVIDSLAS